MLFADWDLPGIAALITSLAVNVGLAIYLGVKKQLREDKTSDRELDRTDEATAVGQLQKLLRDRDRLFREDMLSIKSRHAEDIARLERRLSERDSDINKLAERERDCQITQAKQSVELAHANQRVAELEAELEQLKSELRQRGEISPDSSPRLRAGEQ